MSGAPISSPKDGRPTIRLQSIWRHFSGKVSRNQLTLTVAAFLAVLIGITFFTLLQLFFASTERASEVRKEIFLSDLRDVVGRYDADERYVLENNLPISVSSTRPISPLLLPRQYYTGLPGGSKFSPPRPPPRNCFVTLTRSTGEPSQEKICSYFTDNATLGKYLFFSAIVIDNDFVPLTIGDSTLTSDALRISIESTSRSVDWWVTFQVPPSGAKGRYELTAFREISPTQRERDKRFEGWAYSQNQADGTQIFYLVARIDYKEFFETLDEPENMEWPPENWRTTRIQVARKNVDMNKAVSIERYRDTGIVNMSVPSLASRIFDAYGTLKLSRNHDGVIETWDVQPSDVRKEAVQTRFPQRIGGDLLWPTKKSDGKPQVIPDTELSLIVEHPWIVIERGFWQTTLWLVFLLIGGAFASWYFYVNLLKPVYDISKQARLLMGKPSGSELKLPHSEKNNEIGTLSKAFNALLEDAKQRLIREQADRVQVVRNREMNLKVIGHEIRSPLQALVALHAPGDSPSKRYIDRMVAALPHLQGGYSAEDMIGGRAMELVASDLATFLSALCANAAWSGLSRVDYSGPPHGVISIFDEVALEDAVSNILTNANRYRSSGTSTLISLIVSGNSAFINISNSGPNIGPAILAHVFDFRFSTAESSDEEHQGIGLYVAKQYVSAMNGELGVKNLEGGVLFSIRLPLVASSDKEKLS